MSAALLVAGAVFLFAGTVGLLRFPDVYSRLHALAKADNLGLGCIVIGLALDAPSIAIALKLGITWVLVLVSSSVSCQLVARLAWREGVPPWRRR